MSDILKRISNGGRDIEFNMALGKSYHTVPMDEHRHERDCAYVTTAGPAPCTCRAIHAYSPLFSRPTGEGT